MIPPPGFRRIDPNAQAPYPKPQLIEHQQRLKEAFEQVPISGSPSSSSSAPASSSPLTSITATRTGTIGFNGRLYGGLVLVNQEKQYATVVGNIVLLTSVSDTQEQQALVDPTPARPPGVASGFHTNPIQVIVASRSGRFLAVGGSGTPSDVVVWDTEATPVAKIYARLQHHTAGLRCLSFSPDERFILTSGNDQDGKLFIYDLLPVASGQTPGLVLNANSTNISRVAFGGRIKDAKGNLTPTYQIATATTDRVEFSTFAPQQGTLTNLGRVNLGAVKRYFNCLTWSPDERLLFGGTTSGDVLIVLASTRILIQTITPVQSACGAVGSINFLSGASSSSSSAAGGGQRVLVGRKDGTLTTYENRGGLNDKYVDSAQFKVQGSITSFAQSVEDRFAIVGTEESTIYRVDLSCHPPSSTRLSQAHVSAVRDVAFSHDGATFATVSADSTVQVWNASTLQQVSLGGTILPSDAHPAGRDATCCAFSQDAILVGYAGGAVRAFNPSNGTELWNLPTAHKSVSSIKVSVNGRYFITGASTGETRCWNFVSRALLNEVKEHTAPVADLAVCADSQRCFSVSSDKRLVEADLHAGRLKSMHESRSGGISGVVLTPNEEHIITIAKDNALSWWKLSATQPIATVTDAHGIGGEPLCLALTSDGSVIASGDANGRIYLWSQLTRKQLGVLTSHTAPVRKVAFSPDGTLLISVGEDGGIVRWNITR